MFIQVVHFFLILIFFSFVGITKANDLSNEQMPWINTLDEPYLSYEESLSSDPSSVLKQHKETQPKDNTDYQLAQSHLLFSYAYGALVFPDLAIENAQIAINLVDINSQPWLYHRSQLALAQAYDISGTPLTGLQNANNALKWAQNNNEEDLQIEALTTIGYIHVALFDYTKALTKFQQAYKLAEKSKDFSEYEIASAIALIYEYRKENQLSIPFFEQSVEYHRAKNNWIELSIALYGLGRANGLIGHVDLAKKQLQESAKIAVEINDTQGAAYAWKELAGMVMEEKNYQEAKELLLNSLKNFRESNNKSMLFDVNKVLSILSLKLDDAKAAQSYIDTAKNYIHQDKNPTHFISALRQQADIMSHQNFDKEAFEMLKKVMSLQTSLTAKNSTLQLHQIRTKYELEKKESTNQLLAKENEISQIKYQQQYDKNNALKIQMALAVLALAIMLFLFFRLRQTKKHFEQLANYDSLTGLYTRSKALALISDLFEVSKAKKKPLYVIMLDLDYFKNINDQFGHMIGDKVLKEFGKLCSHYFGSIGICGRFGGEEFIIALNNKSKSQTLDLLSQLQSKTHAIPKALNLQDAKVSYSAGMCLNENKLIFQELIKCADELLYQAKINGRTQVVSSE